MNANAKTDEKAHAKVGANAGMEADANTEIRPYYGVMIYHNATTRLH